MFKFVRAGLNKAGLNLKRFQTETLIRMSGVPLASAVCRSKQLFIQRCAAGICGVPLEATALSGVALASAVCRLKQLH